MINQPPKREPNVRVRVAVLVGVVVVVLFIAIPFYLMGAWHFICHDMYGQPDVSYTQSLWIESVVVFVYGCYYLVVRETRIE